MFRATMCPSSGENYCIYATLVFVTLYMGGVWSAGWSGCPKHVENENKYTKQNCALICIYLQEGRI